MSATDEIAAIAAEWRRISAFVKKETECSAEQLIATAAATDAMLSKSKRNFSELSQKKRELPKPAMSQDGKVSNDEIELCLELSRKASWRKKNFDGEGFLDYFDAVSITLMASRQAYERKTRTETEREAKEAEERGAREEAARILAEAEARRIAEEEERRRAEEERRAREKAAAERRARDAERRKKNAEESRARRQREEALRIAELKKDNKIKKRWHFRQFIKTLVFLMPLALCVGVGIDLFNKDNEYRVKIPRTTSLSWGVAVFLFVLFCILSLIITLVLISRMFSNEYFVSRKKIAYQKRYNAWAVIVFAVCVGVASINLVPYALNQRKNKMTFFGGDYKTYEYVEKGKHIILPEKCDKSNKDGGSYITEYSLKGWEIGEEFYLPGAEYDLQGKEEAHAVFNEFSYGFISRTYSAATITIRYTYNGVNVEVKSKETKVPLGAEVTVTVSFKYSYTTKFTVNNKSVKSPYTFTMEGHTSVYASSEDAPGCFAEGTLITVKGGVKKPVEDLKAGDELLAFNHETGKFEYVPLLVNVHALQPAECYDVISLRFSDGNVLRIVDEHGLFDLDLNKYVYIDGKNAEEFIGHRFVSVNCESGKIEKSVATLERVERTNELIKIYNPASVWHINLVANDMLTLSAGMTNLFEYGEGMKYDEEAMRADIERYGLYTYDDFKEYVSEEVFAAFPFKYYKPAVEKGLFTMEELLELIRLYDDSASVK